MIPTRVFHNFGKLNKSHDLVVGLHWAMNELLIGEVHLAYNFKHIPDESVGSTSISSFFPRVLVHNLGMCIVEYIDNMY